MLLPCFGWYRVDPRGNRSGIDAQFVPPVEQLAFRVSLPGEIDFREVRPEPLRVVVETLRRQASSDALTVELPDLASP